MMGVRTPETCWAIFKRQVINLRRCCIHLNVNGFRNVRIVFLSILWTVCNSGPWC
jgi:hypothetical protein